MITNLGNLREPGSTQGFRSFDTPEEGLAALEKDLLAKITGKSPAMRARYGDNYAPTLANLVNVFAPPTENDTGAYIKNVSSFSGIEPDQVLTSDNLRALLPAMIRQEHGKKGVEVYNQYANNNQTASDALPAGFELDQGQSQGDAELPAGFRLDGAEPVSAEANQEKLGLGILEGLRTAGEQAFQGLTGNFGDEIIDYPAAGLASLVTGKPFDETLAVARDISQNRIAEDQKNHPYLSGGANIAGSIFGAGKLASGAKAVAPGAVGALASYAKAHPYIASAGLGGVLGSLYGAGSGTEGTRGESALEGGALGAISGPALTYVGRNIVAPVIDKIANSGAGKAASSALAKFAPATQKADDGALSQLATPTPSPNIAKQNTDIFSKTAGQRTQNTDLQRLENDARAGLITPDAQKAIQTADITQNREFHSFVDKLAGGLDKGRDVNAIIDNIGDSIQSSAAAKKGAVNSAYALAREGKGVKINSQDIRQGLWKDIAEVRREGAYDLSQMPKAKAVVKRLATYSSKGRDASISSAKLGELENWRKQASNAMASSQDATERQFLGKMVKNYDSFMERTAADAADIGDAAAIKAFRTAVKERREYGQLFEGNKIVEGIVSGEKSIDDTVKDLIGTGSIKGKKQMADNLDAILKASGDINAAKADLRHAFTRRIYDKIAGGTEADNPNMERLSPAKLKTELENLFIHQSDFAKKLYGEATVKDALKAIDELKLISTTQPNVKNPSGSGELVGRILKTLAKVPVIGNAAGLINSAVSSTRKLQEQKALEGGLAEFQDVIKNYKPRSNLWVGSAAVSAPLASSGDGGGENKREPLRVQIRKNQDKGAK